MNTSQNQFPQQQNPYSQQPGILMQTNGGSQETFIIRYVINGIAIALGAIFLIPRLIDTGGTFINMFLALSGFYSRYYAAELFFTYFGRLIGNLFWLLIVVCLLFGGIYCLLRNLKKQKESLTITRTMVSGVTTKGTPFSFPVAAIQSADLKSNKLLSSLNIPWAEGLIIDAQGQRAELDSLVHAREAAGIILSLIHNPSAAFHPNPQAFGAAAAAAGTGKVNIPAVPGNSSGSRPAPVHPYVLQDRPADSMHPVPAQPVGRPSRDVFDSPTVPLSGNAEPCQPAESVNINAQPAYSSNAADQDQQADLQNSEAADSKTADSNTEEIQQTNLASDFVFPQDQPSAVKDDQKETDEISVSSVEEEDVETRPLDEADDSVAISLIEEDSNKTSE